MKLLNRNTIAVFCASFFMNQMFLAMIILPSLYAAFPDRNENTVLLMYTGPVLACAIFSLILVPLIERLNKKLLILAGLAAILIGGAIIVFSGGHSLIVSVTGSTLTGIGYAFVLNATNVLLAELHPDRFGTVAAMNLAVSAIGSMIITSVGGILAKSNWTHAYYLCFPVLLFMVLFAFLYRSGQSDSPAADGGPDAAALSDADAQPATAASRRTAGVYTLIVILFMFCTVNSIAWNTNNAAYIITFKQIGTTAETGLLQTFASLGGVLGGLVITGLLLPRLKTWAAPITAALIVLPNLACVLGTDSLLVLYLCSFFNGVFFQVLYGAVFAAASKLRGGSGVTLMSTVSSFGSFFTPYVLSFLVGTGDAAIQGKCLVGAVLALIAAFLFIPSMRKVETI